MPGDPETVHKPPRRSRRNPKALDTSSSSPQAASNAHLITSHAESDTLIAQPTPPAHKGDLAMTSSARKHLISERLAPSTPSRSHSTQPSSVRREHMSSEPPLAVAGTKDGNKSYNKAPSRPSQIDIPSMAAGPSMLNLGRASATPSKAYAGPTFHASPAASSLPMPIFFSKSVPNVDKTTSLKKMMESDEPDTASENEESPFVGNGKLEPDRQVREESPLDIFFQADRKAKASTTSAGNTHGTTGWLAPLENLRPDVSPSRGAPRHHSRHPTDSSIGGIFSLDIGGPAPAMASHLPNKSQQSANDTLVSAAPEGVTHEQVREEQRQATILALKNVLLSPSMQQPKPSNSGLGPAPANLGSPPPRSSRRRVSSTHNLSRPSSSPGLASDESRAQRQATLRALAEKQIPSTKGYTPQRPPSSSLRKEVTVPNSPGKYHALETQNTPTQSRMHGSPPASNTRSQTRNRSAAADDNFPIQSLQNLTLNLKHQGEVDPSGPSPTTAAIENDLRRVLKLDGLSSGGARGV